MAIEMRNKRNPSFSMASMSDLVFLLLIFFMLTSTLVAPNAIKLLLPSSNSKTMSKQTITVYINKNRDFFVGERKVTSSKLKNELYASLRNEQNGSVVLRADKTVPVQDIVTVIDVINEINKEHNTKHKVILATKPKR